MDKFGYYSQDYNYANVTNNRVYINRNFNRLGSEGVVPTFLKSNVMYFNPNFSHMASSQQNIVQQRDQAIRPRIHVNPNFIRPKTQDPSNVNSSQINILPCIPRPINTCSQSVSNQLMQSANGDQLNPQMANVSKSRYCLVRQKENKVLIKTPLVKTLPNNIQYTVKVNKYKSISLNSVKKNIASDKSITSNIGESTSNQSHFIKSKYKLSSKPKTNNVQNTRFKYVKRNSITALLNSSEIKQTTLRRVSTTLNKTILKTSFRQTKKIVKTVMKKNNIPCPLYKKYGKCLRMVQGSCIYLHDKKHVSICRKFLKGICHDKQCLLSHDLTDKKMPTCYFYLQGICTKEGCPYLHVKLNEKTKICQDFMKGYCEKGEKCLYRHINVRPGTASKLTRAKKQNSNTQINKRIHTDKTKVYRKITVNEKNNTTTEKESDQGSTKDHRYFRDVVDETASEEQYDLIKPTRCKLGTLPSFIQL